MWHIRKSTNESTQESLSGVITFDESDPKIVDDAIDFLYTARLSYFDTVDTDDMMLGISGDEDVAKNRCTYLAKMYVLADQWDLATLQAEVIFTFLRLESRAQNGVKFSSPQDFTQMLSILWPAIVDPHNALKEVILRVLKDRILDYIGDGDFCLVIESFPDLAILLVKALAVELATKTSEKAVKTVTTPTKATSSKRARMPKYVIRDYDEDGNPIPA